MALLSDVTGIGNVGIPGVPTTILGTSVTVPTLLSADGGVDSTTGSFSGALTADGGVDGALGAVTPSTVSGTTGSFTGNVTAYASDARLKNNVTLIQSPVEKLMRLNGVEYDWIDGCEELGFYPAMKHETGVIAQNIQQEIPDAVSPAPFNKEYLTVDKAKITPLLIEATKQHERDITLIREQVAALMLSLGHI